jgi:outer membrane receptor protein involved in Fe transport
MRTTPAACALLVALFAFAAEAAEIRGRVVARDGTPVAGAAVIAGGLTVATDGEGRFVIPASPPLTLRIVAAGYPEHEIVVSVAEPLVQLEPLRAAEEITVTASRVTNRLGDTPSSVRVVDRDEIASSASPAIDDALRNVPGFTLFRRSGSRTANPTAQGVSLRGIGASGASRAVVLEDGIPLNDPFGGWVQWGRVPVAAIDRVEVLRGGGSDLYGSSALGGAVQFVRRTDDDDAVSVTGSLGSRDSSLLSAFATAGAGRVRISFAGEVFSTAGWIQVAPEERGAVDRPADVDRKSAVAGIATETAGGTRLFARLSWYDESRNNGTPLQTNATETLGLAAGADRPLLGGVATLRIHGLTQEYEQSFSGVAGDRGSERLTRLQSVPSDAAGFSAAWSGPAGSRNGLAAGVEGRWIEGASEEWIVTPAGSTRATAGGTQYVSSLFVEDVVQIAAGTSATASLRYDRWENVDASHTTAAGRFDFADRSDSMWSPRVALLHRIGTEWSVAGSAYRSFRAPTLNELYRGFRVGNVVTEANEDLGAEDLSGIEGGVRYARNGGRLEFRANLFRMKVSDAIANVTLSVTPALITRQRRNLGGSRSDGVELDFDLRVGESWTVSGGYMYVDATVTSFEAMRELEGKRVPHTPREHGTLRLHYAPSSLWSATATLRGSGRQFEDDRNEIVLDGFTTVDLFAERSITRRLRGFVAAENATGERIETGRTPVLTLGQPRAWRAGFSVAR